MLSGQPQHSHPCFVIPAPGRTLDARCSTALYGEAGVATAGAGWARLREAEAPAATDAKSRPGASATASAARDAATWEKPARRQTDAAPEPDGAHPDCSSAAPRSRQRAGGSCTRARGEVSEVICRCDAQLRHPREKRIHPLCHRGLCWETSTTIANFVVDVEFLQTAK
ncbi:hypothetical protein HPB48_005846 [Haemaphysalis longicornis]|uniref:Uncharacterized protein n=1 Tax=Haemaphysalis longicornis TaxID=44386 RepID=A0A9J6GML6_HAELO|nr:hypothetical protein HPB48_005846 [Haemaphysalis longicornis]